MSNCYIIKCEGKHIKTGKGKAMENNNNVNFTQEQEKELSAILDNVEEKQEKITPFTVTKNIPAREKQNFFRECEKAETKKDIFPIVKLFAIKCFPGFPEHIRQALKDDRELWKKVNLNLYACGLAVFSVSHAENWLDYMVNYATFKANTYKRLNDLGAFADLVETSLHLLVCRKEWRIKVKNLHVSAVGKTDIILNGRKTEVGTNGKTWADSEKYDPMKGPFKAVIYGMFTEEEKDLICNLFITGNVREGLKNIADMTYYFYEKLDFYHFMQFTISKTPTIVWKKAGYYQTVYNGSKHSAFLKGIENEKILSVHEILGYNEIID